MFLLVLLDKIQGWIVVFVNFGQNEASCFPSASSLYVNLCNSLSERKRISIFRTTEKEMSMLYYLQIKRQLVRGEDTKLDLRKADLQVLKVVAFGRSRILVGSLIEVFIQLLQLCIHYNNYFQLFSLTEHCLLTNSIT